MSEDAYNKKLADLQKYIPFMENMISQLKDPKWKPREAQLNKMESLYNMITDRNKKWKYETLLKCEEVILKLQTKVKANKPIFSNDKKDVFMSPERADIVTNTVNDIMNALKFNNARAKLNCEMSTPKSPSPVRDMTPHSPKIIPFEATHEPIRKSTNIVDPNELSVTWRDDKQDRYVNEKPDIYSSAAKSLGVVAPTRGSIFDRLGPIVPEVSEKPLLSDADLELLRTGDDFLVICQNDQRPSPPPPPPKQEKSLEDINLKITPRIMPVPASKPKINLSNTSPKEEKVPKPAKKSESSKEEKSKNKESSHKSKSPKTEKIITSDIFGNYLNSIDNMILEDSKKKDKKKDERRHSSEHKKDKHNHDSKHHHGSKHHHKHKDKGKEQHKNEDSRLKNESKDTVIKDTMIKDIVIEKPIEKSDTKEKVQEETSQSSTENQQPEKPKRLADKYNPKPRKHVEVDPAERNFNLNDSPIFENRDPRRRTCNLLPTPSILGSPPFPQPIIPNLSPLPLNSSRNINPNISAIAPLLSATAQQPIISPPQPLPLMTLSIQPPAHNFQSPPIQSWLNDNPDFPRPFQNPVFEPPLKQTDPRRQSFHQDNSDRILADPRRQPKFSPPPRPASPPQFGNNFMQPLFNNQQPLRNEINFVPLLQRNNFEPPSPNYQQNRFEPPLRRFEPPLGRFEPVMPTNHNSHNTVPRKSFCPFEPLVSDKDEERQQPPFQNDPYRRNENHPGYGQYNNRFDRNLDRYGRKLQKEAFKPDSFGRDKSKPTTNEDNSTKDRFKSERQEEGGDKQQLKSKDVDLDTPSRELSHTKYDEIYSKLDSEKETFSSPLECLYSNPKTSVKSFQSFKIPKKPKQKEMNLDVKVEKADEVEEETKSKNKTKENADKSTVSSKIKDHDKSVIKKTESKNSIVSDEADNEDDDIPLGKRLKRRSKTIAKKKIIEDSEEESESEEEEEKEVKEEGTTRSRRLTRQSAIKANRLISKKKPRLKSKKKIQKPKSGKAAIEEKIEEKESEVKEEEKQENEMVEDKEILETEPIVELSEKDEKNVEIEIDTKEQVETLIENKLVESEIKEDVNFKEEHDIKEPATEVQKAKEELLNEAKKKNLNLNDQGAEVLQFILMNYKKIKKIFKSDSSSDEEEKEKKKKKKKREKSSSDDEEDFKEKKKQKEKYQSEDEKDQKEKKKKKEESSSEDEKDEKEKKKKKEKSSSEDENEEKEEKEKKKKKEKSSSEEESVEKEAKHVSEDEKEIEKAKQEETVSFKESNDLNQKVMEEEPPEAENKSTVDTKILEIDEKEIEEKEIEEKVEEVQQPIKQLPKKVKKKVKKVNVRKGKVIHKKFQVKKTINQASATVVKKARRSELDKLHDDIKEMLMGGEVLTSTGKRACTIPKDDSEEPKKEEAIEDPLLVNVDQNSLTMPVKNSNLRVLIEKTDFEKLLTKEVSAMDAEDKQDSGRNSPPKLEKMVALPGGKGFKKKILRKKKHNKWASGIIGRKSKRKISTSEDKVDENDIPVLTNATTNTTTSVVEAIATNSIHDKNYFTDGSKSYCKLCPFRGKYIIQHYRTAHPYSEVVISRMAPNVTEHLINESKEKNFALIVLKEAQNHKKKRFGYKCPFMCPIGTTIDFSENYYDHITSHTGEYRYFCPFCIFSTSNPRNLRAHMVPQHNSNLENHGKPMIPAPPASKYLFGYVCRECNFVQTRKERLENHIKEYHDNKAEIVKINLSLICMEHEEIENKTPAISEASASQSSNKPDHLSECIENVVNGAGLIKTPEPSLVKDLNIFELMSQIEADEQPPVLVKIEPLEPEPEVNLQAPGINIEIVPHISTNLDLTAFVCKSNLVSEDEQTIEQKRLKKMNEIHENVKATRTSIVDKLQSRLDTTVEEQHNIVTTTVPITMASAVVSASKPPPLIPFDRSKKSLDAIPRNLVPSEMVMGPKKVAPISSIINRLQDKLLPPVNSYKQLPATELVETTSPVSSPQHQRQLAPIEQQVTSALHIGPITITLNKNNDILYSCFVPFCVFNTKHAQIFEIHCRVTHQDFVYNQSKCDFCNIKIDHEDTFVSMHDIYRHICTSHSDFLSRNDRNDMLLSDVSIESENTSESTTTNNEVAVPQEVSNVISQADTASGPKYPFVITNVTSVDTEHTEPKTVDVLGKRLDFTLPHEVPNLISQADDDSGPKFPFIITSVTSLAKKSPFRAASPPPQISPVVSLPTVLNSTIPTVPIMTSISSLSPIPTIPTVPIITSISSLSPISTMPTISPIQTSPAIKTYTIASVQPVPNIVPIILNPLAPENEKPKVQLPVISCVQSLAAPRKDIIRPKPLSRLTSNSTNNQPVTNGKMIQRNNVSPSGVNLLSLVTNDGKTVTLKDIPMTAQEKIMQRKSKTSKQLMLVGDVVGRFYKCPQYSCVFSCDKTQEFLSHLSMHSELNNSYVSCLYCDCKTPFKFYMLHLEVQHANCEYACGHCFYRATNAVFVTAHSNLNHSEDPIVVKTPRENMPARVSPSKHVPIKSILKPYVCGIPGCSLRTVFSRVYYDHILTTHRGVPKIICGICTAELSALKTHWGTHNVHTFHCRYCLMGSTSVEDVVNHQAMVHFKNDYCIISRKFVPNPNFPERNAASYEIDDDATYDRLFILYGGNTPSSNNVAVKDNVSDTQITQPNQQQTNSDSLFWEINLTPENPQEPQEKKTSDVPLNIDNAVVDTLNSDEPEIPLINTDLDETVTDPLSFDVKESNGNLSDGDSNDDKDADFEIINYDSNAVNHIEEYTGAMLYKCMCNMSFEDKLPFRNHIIACQGNRIYKCFHCGVLRKSVRTLLTHMNEHGRKRFKCSLCQYKHFSKRFVRDHMNVEHNVHEMMILPATVTKKIDYNNDDFVLRPKLSPVKKITVTGAPIESNARIKSVFFPKDIGQLPRPPIYQTDVYCAICNYATKVKSNMVRHLQAHQNEQDVPKTAPVNPVPCLDKSEKMFDKMMNLALSSHSSGRMGSVKTDKTEETHVPTFIPINKRFVCGADGCNYLCPEEGMLRRHLTTFHSQELNYTCLHCNTKIFEDKIINVDMILKHLKLHDNHLYSCGFCKFIHNLRHKVERHLSDKHADKPPSLTVIREVGKEGEAESTPLVVKGETKKPWRCGMCKFRCTDIEEVKSHAQVKHNVSAKHKCALCEFGSEDVSAVGQHFETSHSGHNVDMIVSYYKQEEVLRKKKSKKIHSEFNTTPLWQRNKSIKHIRGILLEESNNKIPKTPNTKKAKTLKAKKMEAGLVDSTTKSLKRDTSLVSNLPTSITLTEPKKLQPKRRKSRAGSKVTVPLKTEDKKIVTKNADNEVIVISISDEDNSQILDIINIDDIPEKKQEETDLSKAKHNSNSRVSKIFDQVINETDRKIVGTSNEKPSISKCLENTNQKVQISENLNENQKGQISESTNKKSEIIEVSNQTAQITENSNKKAEIIDISNGKAQISEILNQKSQSSEISIEVKTSKNSTSQNLEKSKQKLDESISQDTEFTKINLDDSSDSDVIELSNELDFASQTEFAEASKDPLAEDKSLLENPLNSDIPLDSPLKNIKVVSVCSLKDKVPESVEEEQTEDDVELIDEDEETPSKRLKLDISISEIDTMSKTDLLNGNFVGTYGPYGSPWNGNYKCPLCEKYLSTSSKDFMSHIYLELQYGVYKCTVCDYRSIIEAQVISHHIESHKESKATEKVILSPDQQIIEWVTKLVVFQTRILTLDKETESADTNYAYCNFCDYKCCNLSDMRKHQVRHWAVKPYTCVSCKYEAIQKTVIEKHVKRCHPGIVLQVNEADIGDIVLIKRIRWNGRTERPEDGTETYEASEMDSEIGDILDDLKEVLLSCCHCSVRGKLEELRSHINVSHPNQDFKVFRYKCNYCASTTLSLRTLDQHFISCHSGMKRSYSEVSDRKRTYQCPDCPISDDILSSIKEHVRTHYRTIKCGHCDVRVVYWKTMRKHYREKHSADPFEFLYLIPVEKQYEKALSRIKVSSSSKLALLTAANNKNRKRKREDEDISLVEDSVKIVKEETSIIIEDVNAPKTKQVARKSTGYRKPKEIESHYGKKPDCQDFDNIITTVDVMGASITMDIIKLSKILNISPIVLVEDCRNNL